MTRHSLFQSQTGPTNESDRSNEIVTRKKCAETQLMQACRSILLRAGLGVLSLPTYNRLKNTNRARHELHTILQVVASLFHTGYLEPNGRLQGVQPSVILVSTCLSLHNHRLQATHRIIECNLILRHFRKARFFFCLVSWKTSM